MTSFSSVYCVCFHDLDKVLQKTLPISKSYIIIYHNIRVINPRVEDMRTCEVGGALNVGSIIVVRNLHEICSTYRGNLPAQCKTNRGSSSDNPELLVRCQPQGKYFCALKII